MHILIALSRVGRVFFLTYTKWGENSGEAHRGGIEGEGMGLDLIKTCYMYAVRMAPVYWNACFSVDGILWEGLGRCGFVRGVSLEKALRLQKSLSFPVSLLCLMLVDQDVSSQQLLQCHA